MNRPGTAAETRERGGPHPTRRVSLQHRGRSLGSWLGRWLLYLGRRSLGMAIVLFGVATITFIVTRLLGTPVALLVGNTATAAAIKEARHNLGLDQPLYVQYGHFLAR